MNQKDTASMIKLTDRRFVLGCGLALGAIAALLFADARPADAAQWYSPFPWCAQRGSTSSQYTDCSFYNMEQCLTTVRGDGGRCYENPHYVDVVQEPRRYPKSRRVRAQ